MGILEFSSLLKKYREQKCSREEIQKLWSWISDKHNKKLVKEFLLEDLNYFTPVADNIHSVDFNSIFKNIEEGIAQVENERSIYPQLHTSKSAVIYKFLRIAAIVLFIFFAGGLVSYFVFDTGEEADILTYNEIKAPFGARSEIDLPDGSKVWLNAGSKIRYQNVFNKTNREITLTGEAYFKVAKNTRLPFNVKTGDLNIVAVGTEFNVKAYDDESTIETTLLEGRISIRQNRQTSKRSETIMLEPHQKAVYVKEQQQLTVEELRAVRQSKPEVLKLKKGIMYVSDKVDPEPDISWKDNRLILNGEELSGLLVKLERKYDVTFSYESESIKQFRFTGTLENETLTQLLDVIKLSAPIEYALEGRTVKISENKQMMKKFSDHLKKK